MSHPVMRRAVLGGLGSLFAWPYVPRLAHAAGRDPRLLVVILRGGLDGISMLQPVGDPAFAALRGADAGESVRLDNMFALHANMPKLLAMFRESEALALHAAHTPYRGRSHFDGQDVLESGLPRVTTGERTGWLNRALVALPRGGRVAPPKGLAVAPVVPVIMQGPAPVETWQLQQFRYANEDLVARLLDLYEARDPRLAEALRSGAMLDNMMQETPPGQPGTVRVPGRPDFVTEAAAAARIMAQPDGPRVAALGLNGWDTHAAQGTARGGLANRLGALDDALGALRTGLGPVWADTIVAVVTEFGRTARLNGTGGTDHGMATAALLLGGRLKGGRVLADWPGLAPEQLNEGRDLRPTTDLRAVLAGVMVEHLQLPPAAITRVFPDTSAVRPYSGLIRA
ncbi:DUF1501 domain-containing protein [Roseomonas populi]|uniref:DUF1501 domain-containing protein n=1 Tax=Roseomonas populi TaxID=3121582 RepID=A0ABT1X2U0_9PROT|nr:DUF1501 domain-containing protein [Roseomonas pecuniae]MCR0982418.1 DUF1501 domain-containing protein [Roseomonas pecuniae]